ncbi:TA system antitoxin ParD family protein [Croceicoccus marinus]|uniref:Uncharacterized protein n=1 Tax=Croceicoccus marinus TaxID=450378 RepID=A0A217EYT9_9SPHN|nr:hypothetical protein [Croceicoccus marinus]ARU18296.1 hypothetical protein A9D14_18240 [Croceicoccus marinus]
MAKSIKIADELFETVQASSQAFSRTLAGQVSHYIRIGQAVESLLSHDIVARILQAKISSSEDASALDALSAVAKDPSSEEIEFHIERQLRGLGVGLDDSGNLVYQRDINAAKVEAAPA